MRKFLLTPRSPSGPWKRLLPLLIVTTWVFAAAQSGLAQCQYTSSEETAVVGPAPFGSDATEPPATPNYASFTIGRVVGPGTPSEFDSSTGLLQAANWSTYVQYGVLSDTAWLGIGSIVQVEGGGGTGVQNGDIVGVYLNNQLVGSYSVPLPPCVGVSTRYLKFPQRIPGQAVTPVSNTIGVTIVPQGHLNPGAGAVVFGPLSFKAMAPVIMVHGWDSGPWFWGPANPGSTDRCGPDLRYPIFGGFNGGLNFIQYFQNEKIPFECQVTIPVDHSSVAAGAADLEGQITSIASQFGSQYVHLIGHSKGGLWIRAVLPRLRDDNIGVYSVTTIDTPHHGSSLADLLVLAHKQPYLGVFNPRLFLGLFRQYDSGADDLQTSQSATTNSLYPNPTNIQFSVNGVTNYAQYFSVAADADANNNGSIDGNEGYPYPSYAVNTMYRLLGAVQSVSVTPVTLFGRTILQRPTFATSAAFQKNDLLVTAASAQFDGFSPIAPGTAYSGQTPYFLANHKTISGPAYSAASASVIQKIQTVQSQQ